MVKQKGFIASPQYQALTPEQQAAAQEQYFNEVVAPKAGNRAEEAQQAFYATYPAPVSQPANRSQQSGQEQGNILSELGNAAEQAGRGLINIPFDVLQGGASLINAISQGLGGRKFLMMCIARWIAPQTLMHRLGKQSGGVFSRLVLLQKSLYLAVRKNLPVI